MDTAIRIGLILLAIAVGFTALAPLVSDISTIFDQILQGLNNVVQFIYPYLLFGRRCLNMFLGNASLAGTMLWLNIILPIVYLISSLVFRAYKLVIGR